MIILQLEGGLGNQMFMYAFARKIQKITNEHIFIDCSELWENKKMSTPRSYALNNFKLNSKVHVISPFFAKIVNFYAGKLKLLYKELVGTEIIDTAEKVFLASRYGLYSFDNYYKYYDNISYKAPIKLINSYFMSEKYFQEAKNEIIQEFKIVKKCSGVNAKMLKRIKQENSVCVHIRLGDYLSPKIRGWIYVCDENYFIRAMRKIAEEVEKPQFFVFAPSQQDINYIKKNFRFEYDVIFVELRNPDFEELRLMKNCKHFIISNSTFSWWAQYLSKNPNKVIVAPNIWDRSGKEIDIYQENWKLIEV